MKNQGVALLALGLILLAQGQSHSLAAKKYYPPGFTPPTDDKQSDPTPQVIIQQIPGSKQVIIKTVPVTVEKVISKPAKPKDPLQVLIEEHRYYDALRLVESRLQKSPNNLYLQMTRGQILREEGSFQRALEQYQSIFEKNKLKSAKAGALNGIGWTHYQKALYDRQIGDIAGFEAELSSADASFRQATRLSPTLSYAWTGLGKVALSNGQLKDADQWIKKAKRLTPNNLAVQLAESELLLAQNKAEDALQILYGIKKTTTHEPEVFLLLAKASLATDKVDDAIINLKQMLGIVPDSSEGLKLLSQSYERKMKPEDAAQVLEKAISINPGDVDSVEGLIKIYDQRNQSDRSVLLLKSLLKDKPGQAVYGRLLLERLTQQGQWEEAYNDGLAIISPILSNANETEAAIQPVVNLYSQAVFHHGRGLLDRQTLLKAPPTQKVRQFANDHLQKSGADGESREVSYDLDNRLNLLLLDPLAKVAPLPATFVPSDEQLPTALQIAVLQGDWALRERLLKQAQSSPKALSIANKLYNLGDYNGTLLLTDTVIAQQPTEAAEASQLKQKAAQEQASLKEHMETLSILPKRISSAYWQKAATEALQVGNGNWETHALVAKGLEKRKQPALALRHQKLAAQYATSPKDRQYWQRKAEKTAKSLGTPNS